jgi:hypothetical protein
MSKFDSDVAQRRRLGRLELLELELAGLDEDYVPSPAEKEAALKLAKTFGHRLGVWGVHLDPQATEAPAPAPEEEAAPALADKPKTENRKQKTGI